MPEKKIFFDLKPRSVKARMVTECRSWIKKIIGSVVSIIPPVQRSIEQGLTVFAFHEVSNKPSQFAKRYGLFVSTDTFERQIIWIKNNFEIVHPTAILKPELLPSRAAVISFDDGFKGAFENGLPILEKMDVPSVIFLNMQPILSGNPIISATACYLSEFKPDFTTFCRQAGLESPFHLSLNPLLWEDYKLKSDCFDISMIRKYQGELADYETLRCWDGHPLVCYGNHLFEHWNAVALSTGELENQFINNKRALSSFFGHTNLFAFTNGQPMTCFNERDIKVLKRLGAARAFSSTNGVNKNKNDFLLGRISLSESDNTNSMLWFRIGRNFL